MDEAHSKLIGFKYQERRKGPGEKRNSLIHWQGRGFKACAGWREGDGPQGRPLTRHLFSFIKGKAPAPGVPGPWESQQNKSNHSGEEIAFSH